MTGSGATPSGHVHSGWCNHGSCDEPAPAQEAGSGRQAAVEAVARWLFARGFNMGLEWDETPEVLREMMRDRVHELVRDHGAEVAALSQPGEPT